MRASADFSAAQRRDAREGFTLVETLVTILVIVVLLAILMPALGGFRASARSAQCLSNLRGAGLVTGAIVAENRDLYPFWVANMPPSPPVLRRSMTEVYSGHLSTLEVFVCPADPYRADHPEDYTSYRYWPGEKMMDDLSDHDARQAIVKVSREFRGYDSATILFDRSGWHPGETHQATWAHDWRAEPFD